MDLEAHLLFEDAGKKVGIAVHLDTIPARVGDHDRRHTHGKRINVGSDVDVEQIIIGGNRVVLVYPSLCASIASEMLCARYHISPPESHLSQDTHIIWFQSNNNQKKKKNTPTYNLQLIGSRSRDLGPRGIPKMPTSKTHFWIQLNKLHHGYCI